MIIFKVFHRIYKKLVSPFLGNNCRFHPSCSDYALEALEKHGILRGGILSIKRILKCQPFSSAGWSDPVPDQTIAVESTVKNKGIGKIKPLKAA